MSDMRAQLERFLATDPRDVGCDAALEVLHVYSELFVAGGSPRTPVPRHRRAPRGMRTVRNDFAGLVASECVLGRAEAPPRTRVGVADAGCLS